MKAPRRVCTAALALRFAAIACTALSGCTTTGALNAPAGPARPGLLPTTRSTAPVPAGRIQHVVFIIQENRSFDDHFPGYVPPQESKLYFELAQQYVLADRMFTSHIDASFVSHQYAIAGQAQASVNIPTGTWGCSGGPSDQVSTWTP